MTMKWLGERINTIKIMSEDVCCGNCENFYQHYVKVWNGNIPYYVLTNCGHCTYPRIKERQAGQHCKNFEPRKE